MRRFLSALESSHMRNIYVTTHLKEVVYDIPFFCERHLLGAPKLIQITDYKLVVQFDRAPENPTTDATPTLPDQIIYLR